MGALVLVVLALAVAASGARAEAAGPPVRVHGTDTWRPVLELALDEVALLRNRDSEPTRPTLLSGSSLLRLGRDAAAVQLAGVSTLEELVAAAKALRAINRDWDVRLVLYTPGAKRTARTRRLLTDEIVVRAVGGAESTERVSDPLEALAHARVLAARADVAAAEPVALAPDHLRQRLARKLTKLQRQDKAHERQQFFALKRLPPGERRLPVERYARAYEEMARMPLHSTAGGGVRVPPGDRATSGPLAAFLGTWTPLGPGNVGGRTRALVIDPTSPSTLYAGGVAGGVWKTTDGGASWTPLTDTMLPNLAIGSLDIDPTNSSVLYAGTGEGIFNGDAVRGSGIFKTVNGGATWTPLAATATDDFHFVNKVKVLGNGTTVLAATGTGLWRSQDSGATWTPLIDGRFISGCLDIAVGDSYVLASCGTFAQGTVHRSASPLAADGFPFTPTLGAAGTVDLAMGRTSLAVAPSNPSVVYALASSTGAGTFHLGLRALYRSTDRGLTWQARASNTSAARLNTLLLTNPIFATACFVGDTTSFFNQGWYDNAVAVDPVDPNRVWVGGIDLFRSDDGGLNFGLASFWWTDSQLPGALVHADQHAIAFHPGYNGTTNQIMFVGNDGGIYRTTTARGSTTQNVCSPDDPPALAGRWTGLNNGYGVTQFYHGLPYPGPDGGNTFFGGAQDNGVIRGTVAAGIDGWSTLVGGDGGYVAVDPTNPNVIYTEDADLSIRKSTDGGATLVDAVTGIANVGFLFITPFVMSPNNPQILWTGGERMWRTTTGAGAWAAASAVLGCGSVSAIAVAPRAGLDDDSLVDQIVFAGTSGGCVFRTRTALGAGGATAWTRLSPVGNGYVSSIAFDPTNANVVYVTHSTFGSVHVERSVDGGVTFGALDGTGSTLPDVPTHTLVVAPGNPSRLYLGTDVGVFSSDDGGENWSVENTGFANVITEALALGQVGGVDHVFAFTHGRGVFRVALPASMADIATVQASVPAGAALAGRPIAVTDTAKNVGTAAASAGFAVTYALVPVSAAGTPTSPDIALAESRTVAALAGQASSQATTSIVLPSVPSGSYRIRVMADLVQQVAEDPAPQNNQRLTNTFTIVRPDLTVTSVTPALTAAPGGGLNVTHTLRNLAASPAHAPPSVTTFHLATNQSMASVVGVLGNTSAPGVAAGATSAAITGSSNVVPPGTPPGRYFVIAQANATAAFAEVSTANNVLASSAAVLVGPDLLITSAAATPAGVIPGGNLSVTFTARNQGGAPATFDVGFGLVPVTTAGVPTGAPDVVLGTYGQAVSLAAGQTSAAQTKVLTLAASVPVGSYKVRVTADPDNAVTEASEANNSVLATALTTVAQPDLVVPSVTFAPAATRANGSVTITHLVRNLGGTPGHAPASISRLFLGAVNDSVAGAFDLGTVRVNPVTAGATQSASRLVTVPPGIAPGLYFALAVADDGGVVVESDELNNRGASVARLVVGPDLVVSAGLTPAGASPGSRVSVTHTIANRGGEAAGPFSVAFALVPVTATGVPTGAPAIALGPDRTGVVVPAGSAGASFVSSLPLPLDIDPGTYRIRLTADSGNVVVEADETNNTLLTRGVLTIARANLAVQSVTFAPAASRANGSVTVTHVVRNAASAPGTAAPTISSLFLNAASAGTTGALFLANVSVPQIPGGGTASIVKPVTVPLGTPPGLYFVVAQADADGTLIEPDENNTTGSQARLVVGPDLTVSTATAAAGVATGANLSVSFTLRNVGGEAAGSFDVGFRLVPVTGTGVPTGDPEIALGSNRPIAALAAGATQALTSSLPIPAATVTGTYRVRVSVDASGVVSEASEANNELLTGLVRVARPDLTAPSVRFTPPAVASGGTVTVTHIVKNVTAAAGGAPASQSAIYLSQNASLAGVLGPLATVNAPALAPNGATTLARAVSVGNLSTGVYFFVVRADDPDAIVEENEGNNVGFSATGLLVGPDAGVTAATTVTGAGPGTNVSVSYTLRNFGAAATGTFDVTFEVTPVTAGGVPSGTPIALGIARSLPGLAAGQTLSFSNQARLPADLAPGTYRIGVTLAGFSSSDANAANDRLLTRGVLTVVRPDLVMSAFTPPATLIAGRTASLTNSARNSATTPGTAGPFGVGVYVSGNGNRDITGDTLVGNRSVSGLAAGGTSSVPIAIAVPASPGNVFLKAFADFTDLVVEANESNNVTVKPVAVVPDLTAGRTTPITATISFSIGPGSSTCFLNVSGDGTTSEKITSQTGAAFSGGQLQFADSLNGGAVNTVTFSGTVSTDGAVLGTFTLSRAGGGGGSGSGSFNGTASVGSPGALTLQLLGTFSGAGGGTCPLAATVTFNGTGP